METEYQKFNTLKQPTFQAKLKRKRASDKNTDLLNEV